MSLEENVACSIYLPWWIKLLRRGSCPHRLFLTTLKQRQIHKSHGRPATPLLDGNHTFLSDLPAKWEADLWGATPCLSSGRQPPLVHSILSIFRFDLLFSRTVASAVMLACKQDDKTDLTRQSQKRITWCICKWYLFTNWHYQPCKPQYDSPARGDTCQTLPRHSRTDAWESTAASYVHI
jgi:hypothetical protein